MTMTMLPKAILLLVVMMLATPHSQATPSAHAAADYRSSAPSPTLPCTWLTIYCSAAERGWVRGGAAAAFQTKDEILPSTFTPHPPPAPPALLLQCRLFLSDKVPYS